MHSPDPRDSVIHSIYISFFRERISRDLIFIVAWLTLAVASIYLPVLNETPLRVIFTLPVILFIPGYALIAALFPEKEEIDLLERIALSFGLSIAVVPLIGLGLNYTPWGIRLDPIVTSLTIFTLLMILIAQFRRGVLGADVRFVFPFRPIFEGIRDEFVPPAGSTIDRVLSLLLLVSIIAAIGTTIFVIAFPKDGEKFTEFYILGSGKKAADYPRTLIPGESYPMYIGIGNHEYRNISYTVEVHSLSMLTDDAGNLSYIERMNLLDRRIEQVSHNETVVFPYNLTIHQPGYKRIQFLLFNEALPDETITGMERINQSYRDLHLWVTVP